MKPQISILGLGWGSVGFLQNIDTNIYDIEVFSLDNEFVYTPLLAQNIRQRKRLSLHGNQIIKGAKFTNREISNIDFDTQTLISKTKEKYIYRYLVLSHGASINTFNIPGVEQYTYFLKNDHHAEMIRKKLQSLPIHSRVAVIGCGLTGTEVIGSLVDYDKFKIHAIDGLPRPITMFDEKLSNTAIQLWKKNDIDIRMNQIVSSISENTIQFKNKTEIPYDMAIWCGGIKKSSLTDSILSTLKIENNKGIPVNKSLKVENTKNVWAIGDCAFTGLPPTAQVAYQQGSYLAHQFNSHFKDLSEFQFQNKGQIGYIGNKQSVCQLHYFQSGGNLTFYLNKLIHVYNGVTWKQKFYIFND
jgi:NADH:ubiquinone reductase (non-electrogenic)